MPWKELDRCHAGERAEREAASATTDPAERAIHLKRAVEFADQAWKLIEEVRCRATCKTDPLSPVKTDPL